MIRQTLCCIAVAVVASSSFNTAIGEDEVQPQLKRLWVEKNGEQPQLFFVPNDNGQNARIEWVDDGQDGPWFGVHAMPVPDFLSEQLGLEKGKGLVVRDVHKGSSAGNSGIAKHDILMKVDDKELNSPVQLWELMRDHKIGDELTIDVIRKGENKQIKVKLEKRQDDGVAQAEKKIVPFLGVSSVPVTPALTDQLNLPEGQGALVLQVMDGSSAAKAGLQKHDIIQKVNDDDITTGRELRDTIRSHKAGEQITISVLRGGDTVELKAVLDEREVIDRPGVGQRGIRLNPDIIEIMPNLPLRIEPLNNNPADVEKLREEHQRRIEEMRKRIKEMMEQNREGLRLEADGMKIEIPRIEIPAGGHGAVSVSTRVDNEHVITLTRKGDTRHVVAKDREGNVLFDGPIDTPDQLEAMPEAIREKVKQMDKPMNDLREQTDPKNSPKRRQGVA